MNENVHKMACTALLVVDTMYDAVLHGTSTARKRSTFLKDLRLEPKGDLLATVHRPYNTAVPEESTKHIKDFLGDWRTRYFPNPFSDKGKIDEFDGNFLLEEGSSHTKMMEPGDYLDILMFEQNTRLILTDSGRIQKEDYFFDRRVSTCAPRQSGWRRGKQGGIRWWAASAC